MAYQSHKDCASLPRNLNTPHIRLRHFGNILNSTSTHHCLSLTHSHSHSLSLTHSHSHTLSLSHSHSLSHTQTHTHMHTGRVKTTDEFMDILVMCITYIKQWLQHFSGNRFITKVKMFYFKSNFLRLGTFLLKFHCVRN